MLFYRYLQLIAWLLLGSLLASAVFAQSVIFSPDQWPKRWERVMQHQPMNGYIKNNIGKQNKIWRARDNRVDYHQNRSRQSWGQQPKVERNNRSRVPEYAYRSYNRNNWYTSASQYYQPYKAPVIVSSYPLLPSPLTFGSGFNSSLVYPNLNYSSLALPGFAYPDSAYTGLVIPGIIYPW